ncbi:MAG: C45 family peptidase, partial [Planctomycetota bacterium]
RMRLCRDGFWAGDSAGRANLSQLARDCWEAQQRYDPLTTTELEAMSHASGVPATDLLVAGGFTDFVDAVRAASGGGVDNDPGQCTAALVSPRASADGKPYLAQTWDMHPSATPHLRVLSIDADDQPAAVLFTLAGCVGMTGVNEHGVAIGINNLTARDGRPGVLWPTVVRAMLREASATAALDVLWNAPLAGAHHYLILDAQGCGYAVEATPTRCAVTRLSSTLAHTNHCVLPETVEVEAAKSAPAKANSCGRLASARIWLADHPERLHRQGLRDLLCLRKAMVTGIPGAPASAICHEPLEEYEIETGGAVVMSPTQRTLDAAWRVPRPHDFQAFGVPSGQASATRAVPAVTTA